MNGQRACSSGASAAVGYVAAAAPSPSPQPRTTTVAVAAAGGWGWRRRFLSPDHFVFNAFVILVLASGLIVAESFQFFFCYLARLECLDFYKTPPAALLYASGLVVGLYLLLPGVLCLLAARRAPAAIESAMWSCLVGCVLVALLLCSTVFEVAQYARLITGSRRHRDRRSVNLLVCLACITLGGVQLAFLCMEACVCRRALRCRRKGYAVAGATTAALAAAFYGDGDIEEEDEEEEEAFNGCGDDGPTSL